VRDAHAVEQLLRAIVHSQLLWGLSTHALTQQLALELVDLQRKAKSTSATCRQLLQSRVPSGQALTLLPGLHFTVCMCETFAPLRRKSLTWPVRLTGQVPEVLPVAAVCMCEPCVAPRAHPISEVELTVSPWTALTA
jgi:hypothetical protein